MTVLSTFRLLSLDGGGSRALIQLQVLKKLEALSGKPIRELFDHIAGASAGGILALAFSCTDKSAVEIEAFFLQMLPRVFPSQSFSALRTLAGPLYDSKPLEHALTEFFGKASCRFDARTGLTIPAFDTVLFTPVVFENISNVPCVAAAMATAAAPTYFKPADGYMDGGVWANNPCLQALVDTDYGGSQSTVVLSLGSGRTKEGWGAHELDDKGAVGLIKPLVEIFTDGAALAVDQQVAATFAHRRAGNAYVRLQRLIPDELGQLDQSDPEKLARLILEGQALVAERAVELASLADWLKDGHL